MQPIFIGGVGPRQEVIDEGTFDCPNCGTGRPYQRIRTRNYFRLYFIPVVPLGEATEFVRCGNCGQGFDPVVLTARPAKRKVRPLAEQLNTLQSDLEGGKPVEYAIAELTAAGLDRDIARQNVVQVIGTARRSCPECGLTYAANVERCREDDLLLVDV